MADFYRQSGRIFPCRWQDANGICNYMTKPEKEMWRINIENAAATVAEQYGNEVVESVFRRYDAQGLYDLSPCYFSEVFGDLELIANDN